MRDKVIGLKEAASQVQTGMQVAIGGAIFQRQPMALIYELVRSGVKDLKITSFVCANGVDLLVGTGQVTEIEAAYSGVGPLGRGPWITRKSETGELRLDDLPESAMMQRFRAAGVGLPSYPTKVLLGTSMSDNSRHVRKFKDPFTGEALHVVDAAITDITFLHCHVADSAGNVMWPTIRNTDECDLMLAKAATRLIVTVERVVSRREIMQNATLVWIPAHWVEAVVEVPWGAHPGSCDGYYTQDDAHLAQYVSAARGSADAWSKYLESYIYGMDHYRYLAAIGGMGQLQRLRIDVPC